ncbi:MAG: hypothetical protein P1R74_12970 [Sedimenticola sp.]|nr:hypothetical protein [Sedimenticola sp.]
MIELIYFGLFILIMLMPSLPFWVWALVVALDLLTEGLLPKKPLVWLERMALIVWLIWDIESPLELVEEFEVLALIISLAWAYGKIGNTKIKDGW